MRKNQSSQLWRLITCLLLVSVLFSSACGTPARAAPPGQEPEPGPSISFAPGDHLVTNLNLLVDTPNILHFDQSVTIGFNYSTTDPGGVLIFIRPFTNGALSPNYNASGSTLYPTSATGSGRASFTLLGNSGEVVVDQIRIQMYNADESVLLFETFLPVYYLFSASANIVTHINFTPDTPDVLKLNQNVNFTFDYSTQYRGVQIFFRPFSNGNLSPNYAAHGSPSYSGSGNGEGFFTITSRPVVVDQVRIQMVSADQSLLLFEAFLPVFYRFRASTNIVTDIELNPDTPNVFKYGQNVNFTFNYTTNQRSQIWIRPFSGASPTPGYGAHGSQVYNPGSGSSTAWFHLSSGPYVVDRIRVQMWNEGQTKLLFEAFLPVHLLWAGAGPPPGPDIRIDAMEVTQAIQDLNNSVDLVAGKRTYVRVHTSSPVNIADVYATVSGRRGFLYYWATLTPGNPGGDITVRTSPDRGQLNDSFWFELPASWTSAGNLTLTARLDPNNAKNDLNQSNNIRSVTVNFLNTPPLRLRLMNVQYTAGGTTYLAGSSHLASLESWLRRAYPISSLQVARQTYVYPLNGLPNVDTLNGYLAFGKIIRMIFTGEDSRTVYYGVVDDGGGFMRGKAAGIPGSIASGPSGSGDWGWDFDGSYNDWYGGHEIGHTRNRYHAEFCGAGGGASYPYPDGRISPSLTGNTAIYGFDIQTRAIYGPNWKDVMTYCANQWVSDFTYEGIRSYLAGQGGALAADVEPQMLAAGSFLAIGGMADLDNHTATLTNVYLINHDQNLPAPDRGDWTIALLNASNQDLATYPFSPEELTDPEDGTRPAIIAEVVPWADGAVKVEIRYGGNVVASRTASASAPGVTITAPADGAQVPAGVFQLSWTGSDADGNALTYTVLYSKDGGQTWETLGTGLTATSLNLNTDQLPGGPVLFRVVVSDGFLSSYDTTGAINLPLHAPTVEILSPAPNQVFYPTQQVTLQGSAYDLEDDTLAGDENFLWLSDLDGVLGSGQVLNTTDLSAGTHIITLVVTDSDGMTAQAQVTITVGDEETPEPGVLQVSSTGTSVVAVVGSAPTQHALTVRSANDSELNWSASENIPWLSLSAGNGSTPGDVTMTVNPAGLSIGVYSGLVTFQAEGESQPTQVRVTLQVIGRTVFLPVSSKNQP